jgi:hypothetical protein
MIEKSKQEALEVGLENPLEKIRGQFYNFVKGTWEDRVHSSRKPVIWMS